MTRPELGVQPDARCGDLGQLDRSVARRHLDGTPEQRVVVVDEEADVIDRDGDRLTEQSGDVLVRRSDELQELEGLADGAEQPVWRPADQLDIADRELIIVDTYDRCERDVTGTLGAPQVEPQ